MATRIGQMTGHAAEVQQWLGLVPYLPPTGLHGDKRGRIVARHTRIRPTQGASRVLTRAIVEAGAGAGALMPATGEHRWLRAALAMTYPSNRERQIMALLRRQQLDDRLWRWVYALMVSGGPLLLPELHAFVTRLTGPREQAEAEAVRRYREWSMMTYEP